MASEHGTNGAVQTTEANWFTQERVAVRFSPENRGQGWEVLNSLKGLEFLETGSGTPPDYLFLPDDWRFVGCRLIEGGVPFLCQRGKGLTKIDLGNPNKWQPVASLPLDKNFPL